MIDCDLTGTRVVFGDKIRAGMVILRPCDGPGCHIRATTHADAPGVKFHEQAVLEQRTCDSNTTIIYVDESGNQHSDCFGSNVTRRVRVDE